MPYTPILATLGYLLSADGRRVLLIHRNRRSDDPHFGKYNGLGGKLDAGEDVVTCLRRAPNSKVTSKPILQTLRRPPSRKCWPTSRLIRQTRSAMMDRRHGARARTSSALSVVLALAFSGAQALIAQDSPAARSSRPSVLLVTLDTVRADHIGCYGYSKTETPNLDRLASDGIRFSNAYAQVPITLPSHAVILTGTYPMSNGVRDFTSAGLASSVPTLAERLRRNGYRTAAFVSSFVLNSMWGLSRGFEVYDDNLALSASAAQNPFLLVRSGDATVDRLLGWIKRPSDEPFFVWLHLYDAHSPYRSPEPYRSRYSRRPYDGAIAFDDAQVGRVIARLRDLNLYDRTAIVVLSDHGESLGEHGESEHGFFVYNATLRVPLILKLPGEAASARVVSGPVAAFGQ